MAFQSAPPALQEPLAAPRPREELVEAERVATGKAAGRARYGCWALARLWLAWL